MINDRFDELSRKPDAQFLGAGADESRLSPTVGTFSMSAAVEDGKLPAGLSTLEIESNRIKEFGFGAGGARAGAEVDAGLVRARLHRARQERERVVRAGVHQSFSRRRTESRASTTNTAWPRMLIPSITAAEVGDAARRLFADESRVILAVSPQKDGVPVPTDAQLRDALKAADAVAVTAWNDTGAQPRC